MGTPAREGELMFFFSLLSFTAVAWIAPWWAEAPAALLLGALTCHDGRGVFKVSSAAGSAWLAVAFMLDGRSSGVIGQRLAGLFGLPSVYLVYAAMGALGFITAFLFASSGLFIRQRTRFDLRGPER